MTNKQPLSESPIGYDSAKSLWNQYAKVKFPPLKTTKDISDYYDFIFAAGAVGYWIQHEIKEPKDETKRELRRKSLKALKEAKHYHIFNSIYNNTKHYELNQKSFNVYVVENVTSLLPTNGYGDTIWTDDFILRDDALFLTKVEGERMQRYCAAKCEMKTVRANTL